VPISVTISFLFLLYMKQLDTRTALGNATCGNERIVIHCELLNLKRNGRRNSKILTTSPFSM
jgi:hypothetical protein